MADIVKRCFRLVGGGHSKFWTVQTRGPVYFATFGRIGSAGQTQTKTFGNAYEADKYARKMISEKTGKGYVETRGDTDAGASPRLLMACTVATATAAAPAIAPPAPPTVTSGRLTAAPDEENQRGLDL